MSEIQGPNPVIFHEETDPWYRHLTVTRDELESMCGMEDLGEAKTFPMVLLDSHLLRHLRDVWTDLAGDMVTSVASFKDPRNSEARSWAADVGFLHMHVLAVTDILKARATRKGGE